MNRDHFYFKNPKYSTNHICIPLGNDSFGVFEKMNQGEGRNRRPLEWWKLIWATPIGQGETATAAIESAVDKGIKPYDIQIIEGGVQ